MDIIDDYDRVEAAEDRRTGREANGAGEPMEMLQNFRQQLAKDPRNVTLLNEVGLAAEKVGDMSRARWAYKRAIRLDPGYAQSYRNLGLLYRLEGREEAAMETLQKYIQLGGDDVALPILQQPTAQQPTSQAEEPGESEVAKARDASPIYGRLRQVWDDMGLTPAEAMMLLDPESSSGLKMMQYTLLDLVARDILSSVDRQRIGRGKAYGRTNLAPHEALFAKYFSRISDYVDIDKLARAALAEVDDDGDAFKAAYVRGSLLRKGYLELETKRIGGLFPVQQTVPSKKGAMTRNRLQRLLREADRHLARTLTKNPEQVNAYVEEGGPGLLLMDAYPIHQFKRWHEMLTRMGLGPAMERVSRQARKTTLGAFVEEFLKEVLGN